MQERRLHVDAQQHAKPHQINAQRSGHRGEQGHDDERQFKEIEKKRQHEHQRVDRDQKAELSARQSQQQMLHPDMPVHPVERETENARANQDEQDKGAETRGGIHRLAQQLERQAPPNQRHRQRAHRTHRAAFGGCGNTEKDGAEHQEDQRQRRNQGKRYTLRQRRQQA